MAFGKTPMPAFMLNEQIPQFAMIADDGNDAAGANSGHGVKVL